MKKSKIAAIITAGCLAATALVGGTLALFTSVTPEVKNTFTVGDVKIDLTEPKWNPDDAKNLQPGASVDKNPMITNTGKGDGYIVMQVTGMTEMAKQGFSAVYDSTNWVLVDNDGNKLDVPEGSALVDGYYVYNKGAVEAGETTKPLFESVTLSTDTKELSQTKYQIVGYFKDNDGYFTYKDAKGKVIEANANRQPTDLKDDGTPKVTYKINGVDDKTFGSVADAEKYVSEELKANTAYTFDLTVKGYAIQTTTFEFEKNGGYPWMKELMK